MEPVLSVRDLQVGYGSYVLMRNVTFDVAKGDIFFIMGGSGCGKSTLLHVLMGLKSPQAGEVFWRCQFLGQLSRCAAAMYAQCGCAFPKRRPLEFDDACRKYSLAPPAIYGFGE